MLFALESASLEAFLSPASFLIWRVSSKESAALNSLSLMNVMHKVDAPFR